VEQQVVTGIAYSKDEAQISLRRVADKPGVAAAIFGRSPRPTSTST
jgi:aspartate kinase